MERIPVVTTLGIEAFAGGEITVPHSMVTNGIFSQRSDGTYFVTQRPSIDMTEDASDTVTDVRGRGIYYWDAVSAIFFVNDNKVFKGTYGTAVDEAAVSVTDITGDGSDADCTAAGHGYKVGDKVLIAGATQTEYNGEKTLLTVADVNSFTYASTSSDAADSGTATRSLGGGGTDRVYFFELGNYLVIIDQEDNTGWYIAVGSPTDLVEITDTSFPGIHGSLELADGGAVLDGTLYVMDTTGQLAGCDIEDPTSWDALNTINAEVEVDGGTMLAKHNNHVVAFGNRTIEFFYDAQNPTGSPLGVRQDISHEIGTVNASTVWSDQNAMFFVSQSKTGGLAVYMMKEMTLADISTHDIDSFLTSSVYTDSKQLFASGFSIGHTIFYVLTVNHIIDSAVVPLESLVYNSSSNTWTKFDLAHSGIDDCPIIDWTVATDTRIGQGILTSGDLITVSDDWSPYDTKGAIGGVFEDGVFEITVFTSAQSALGNKISMEVITGHTDNGTVNRKFMSSMRLVGPRTTESQTLLTQWSDESDNDYNTGKTVDASIAGQRLLRLGSYRQRNFKVTYNGTERIELDALEVELKAGIY